MTNRPAYSVPDSSRNHTATSIASVATAPPTPHVQCDLCEASFILPAEIAAQGVIYGILSCTQCVEDSLYARHLESQP